MDSQSHTPLRVAAENGRAAMVKLLLDSGQVVANLEDKFGRTPLDAAAGEGDDEIVKLLLDSGQVDAYLQEKFGGIPKHIETVAAGNLQAVSELPDFS